MTHSTVISAHLNY